MADNVLMHPTTYLTHVPQCLSRFSVLRALVQAAVSNFGTREYVKSFSINKYRVCLYVPWNPGTDSRGKVYTSNGGQRNTW
ncbi:hypothetical protein PISMIDRAFT_688531 [Pisolithus microcarpus 441]|uniref:Uncharacterized protein n=1 Tax=Pisolithus microcarpus 441 TaxID=765257 RepID=A0A0C9YIL7_9AGAM|nr:hypothetical protein PISMIDRAFT_688531 [Pisolithus microcarpus 441]